MRRNNATPGAREELHFLFEESVFGKIKTAEERGSGGEDWRGRRGVIDWWRPLKGSYQNQSGMHHASVFSRRDSVGRGGREQIDGRWDSF